MGAERLVKGAVVQDFRDAHHRAWRAFRDGDRSVLFPWRVYACVAVACPG